MAALNGGRSGDAILQYFQNQALVWSRKTLLASRRAQSSSCKRCLSAIRRRVSAREAARRSISTFPSAMSCCKVDIVFDYVNPARRKRVIVFCAVAYRSGWLAGRPRTLSFAREQGCMERPRTALSLGLS
jgi:hypothetical protein